MNNELIMNKHMLMICKQLVMLTKHLHVIYRLLFLTNYEIHL